MKVFIRKVLYTSVFLLSSPVLAQTLPSSADPSRIDTFNKKIQPLRETPIIKLPEIGYNMDIPEQAKQIDFTLEKLIIEGGTAFSMEEIKEIYGPYINKKRKLDIVWQIASEITQYYHDHGYFLSRAFIPAQEIDGGVLTLKIFEGSINKVTFGDENKASNTNGNALIKQMIAGLVSHKPVHSKQVESFLLRLNQLPGKSYQSVLDRKEGTSEITLALTDVKKKGMGSVDFNNYGSRFLGPYQATLNYKDSFIPMQDTQISFSTSIPKTQEMRYFSLLQTIPFYPDWHFELGGNHVVSAPGANLEVNDFNTASTSITAGVFWTPILQRDQTLTLHGKLEGKNVNGDIFGDTRLTRDRIRTIELGASYQGSGHFLSFDVTQGMEFLNASNQGQSNLSRAEASPDFRRINFYYQNSYNVLNDFLLIGRASGQYASGPLYASQEFGYGGNAFGRAFDPSEITGDHGISLSAEMRYYGLGQASNIEFTPFAFYDIGRVWDEDIGGTRRSASSAGMGMQFNHAPSGIHAQLGIAFPFLMNIGNPQYGASKNPRILAELGYDF